MGNSNIKQHIQTAEKTGACQLSKSSLKERTRKVKIYWQYSVRGKSDPCRASVVQHGDTFTPGPASHNHAPKPGITMAVEIQVKFPEELHRLTKNLRTLDLSENKISGLPPIIGSFSLLKNVNLSRNKIETLPSEFGNLKKLESLSLDCNQITCLPDSFVNLSHLRTLNLSGNLIRQIPAQLCQLRHLDALDLSRNKITVLPNDIDQCQVIELNLNQNQISTLPENITSCPRLKVLRLEENCLAISAFTPRIMKESNIALFAYEGNVFDSKAFNNLDGYDEYMERYTATKKKFN